MADILTNGLGPVKQCLTFITGNEILLTGTIIGIASYGIAVVKNAIRQGGFFMSVILADGLTLVGKIVTFVTENPLLLTGVMIGIASYGIAVVKNAIS